MSCVPCTDINALVATVDNLIYKMVAAGQLQAGLLDCNGNRLMQDDEVVLCATLLSQVQKAIDEGAITLPLDVHAETVSFVDDYIVVRLNDGTEIKSETKIPEQVKPTAVAVDQLNHIVITLSDGSQLRTETAVETPKPVTVTAVTVDQDNHIVITLSDGTQHRTETAVETPEPVRLVAASFNAEMQLDLTMSDGTSVLTEYPMPDVIVTGVALDSDNRITVTLNNGSSATSNPVHVGEVTSIGVDADNHIVVSIMRLDGEEPVVLRSETAVVTPAAVQVTGVSIDNDGFITLTMSDGTTVRSATDVGSMCVFVDCNGDRIEMCTAVATCVDLKAAVPENGTEGQVLTYGKNGENYWGDAVRLRNCAGEPIETDEQVPTCAELDEAIANVKPIAGEGILVDPVTNAVSVDKDWLSKQIASAVCGSYTKCGTWNYTVTKTSVPVIDVGSIYYVEVGAAGATETTWFQSTASNSCFDYDAIITDTSSTFILRNGGEPMQTITVSGTTDLYVKVQKLTPDENQEVAGVAKYSDGATGTRNISNIQVGKATVTPTYRIYPNGGKVTDTRANNTRWFYYVKLTTPLPIGTYDILVQADDSLNLNLSGASHDTGIMKNDSDRSRWRTFQLTTTGITHTIYADNYNITFTDGTNPSWFSLVIVDSEGNEVFNGQDAGGEIWYVSQTELNCDAVVINVNS